MKKSILALILSASLSAQVALAAARQITATVTGMTCEACAKTITRKFSADPAVAQARVSLKEKQLKLSLKEGQEMSDEAIKKTMTDLGYGVEKIVRK